MAVDRLLWAEIVSTVRRAMREVSEENEEVWLSTTDMTRQFAMFPKGWLKQHGHLLPRTRAVYYDDDGTPHEGGWCYPRNKIQRMIRENEIKVLKNGKKKELARVMD